MPRVGRCCCLAFALRLLQPPRTSSSARALCFLDASRRRTPRGYDGSRGVAIEEISTRHALQSDRGPQRSQPACSEILVKKRIHSSVGPVCRMTMYKMSTDTAEHSSPLFARRHGEEPRPRRQKSRCVQRTHATKLLSLYNYTVVTTLLNCCHYIP